MPRTGGIYSLPNGYLAVTGEIIQPSQHNPPLEDIAQALTDSLPRNGSAAMTGNLPLNGNRITGLAPAIAPNHAARWDQVMPASGGTVTGIIQVQRPGQDMIYLTNNNYSEDNNAIIRVTDTGNLAISSAIPGSGFFQFDSASSTLDLPGSVVTRNSGDSRYVQQTRQVATGDGLSGGGDLSANRTLSVNNTVVRTTRQINTGSGLAGGGNLTANRELSLALGSLPFSNDTLSDPRVIMLNGENSGTQVRVNPAGFRSNMGIPADTTTIATGDGLSGGGNLTQNRTLSVDGTVVRTSRQVNTGTGLSGGGDLSANRTLSVNISSTGQAQAGSNNSTLMTPLRVAEASIGSSQQSWTGVTGSRTGNTVYQNTTGRPIEMRCLASASGGNAIVQVSPNGSTGWTPVGWYVSDSSQSQGAIVPNGHYYRINHVGSLSITSWAELR